MSASQPTGSAPKRESVDDRTMSMVLSLYISDERMREVFANWNREKRSEIQIGYENTKELREAIDPLFNDIAMRDRNSTLDEFLIDVQGERLVECIDVTMPKTFTWTTEGKTFRVILDEAVTKRLECRMFWYVHSNGSLSYHMSFKVNYEHSFSDFYFLSILQKMVFPKEFYPTGDVGGIELGHHRSSGSWMTRWYGRSPETRRLPCNSRHRPITSSVSGATCANDFAGTYRISSAKALRAAPNWRSLRTSLRNTANRQTHSGTISLLPTRSTSSRCRA